MMSHLCHSCSSSSSSCCCLERGKAGMRDPARMRGPAGRRDRILLHHLLLLWSCETRWYAVGRPHHRLLIRFMLLLLQWCWLLSRDEAGRDTVCRLLLLHLLLLHLLLLLCR